ncbi:MAG: sporulation protein [Armatimonadetes bacterium]|nr:sporulation protein [Armatimonadota bacterium]
MSSTPFDKAKIQIDAPPEKNLGEEVSCEVIVTPKTRAKLRKIEISLACVETAISRGTTDTTSHKTVLEDIRVPAKDVTLAPGEVLCYKETFRIPPEAPPAMGGNNHYVNWQIKVRLDVPWWPDTRAEKSLRVNPTVVMEVP